MSSEYDLHRSVVLKGHYFGFFIDRVIIGDNIIQMNWRITFYNETVERQTLLFPKGILANFLHIVEMMQEYGPALGKPYTASLGDGLFEIRAKGKEGIGRSLFCMIKGREIIILHSFIKKTHKTPKKEIDMARKRMKEVKPP